MPQNSYPFASAKIKSREASLLTREKALRMLNAKNAEEAIKLLSDFGYTGADEIDPNDFEKLLSQNLKEVCKYIDELTPNKAITDLFFMMYDYHNVKVWMKDQLRDVSTEQAVINAGVYPVSRLYDIIHEKKYQFLSLEMRTALNELEKRFAVKPDVSLIGLFLDAAYSKEVARVLEDVDDLFVKQYFAALFDFSNIILLIRMKRANTPKDIFEKSMFAGGTIDATVLKRAYDMDEKDLKDVFAKGAYEKGLTTAFDYLEQTGKLVMFNKVKEDHLMRLAKENKGDIMTIGPVFSYLIAKQREIQAIRMIMIAKLNDMDSEMISEILPELFA